MWWRTSASALVQTQVELSISEASLSVLNRCISFRRDLFGTHFEVGLSWYSNFSLGLPCNLFQSFLKVLHPSGLIPFYPVDCEKLWKKRNSQKWHANQMLISGWVCGWVSEVVLGRCTHPALLWLLSLNNLHVFFFGCWGWVGRCPQEPLSDPMLEHRAWRTDRHRRQNCRDRIHPAQADQSSGGCEGRIWWHMSRQHQPRHPGFAQLPKFQTDSKLRANDHTRIFFCFLLNCPPPQ